MSQKKFELGDYGEYDENLTSINIAIGKHLLRFHFRPTPASLPSPKAVAGEKRAIFQMKTSF